MHNQPHSMLCLFPLALCSLCAFAQPAFPQSSAHSAGSNFGGGVPFGGTTAPGVTTPSNVFPNGTYTPFSTPYGYGSGPYGLGPYTSPYASPYTPGVTVPTSIIPGYVPFGTTGVQYWRAPSGYYYPWGIGATTFPYSAPTYYRGTGQQQPVVQQPPLSSMFSDLRFYLDQAKKEGRINSSDYQHLFQRLQDLDAKFNHLIAMNGGLDAADEDSLRRDAHSLTAEIASRIQPLQSAHMNDSVAKGDSNKTKARNENKSGWIEDEK